MSRVIWKIVLDPRQDAYEVPKGAGVLSAGAQGEDVVVWVLCDENAPKVSRLMRTFPTGVPGVDPLLFEFVATVQRPDGLVFHVFDGGEVVA